MFAALSKKSPLTQATEDESLLGESYGRLRQALFSYATQQRKESGVLAIDEILTAKEIMICNMATD